MQTAVHFENGAAWLTIDQDKHLPVAFRSFWPQPETVAQFSARDFSLFGVFPSGILCSLKVPYSQFGEIWTGEGQYNWANLDAQVDLFISQASNARMALMVHLDTRDWFLAENPGCADSFSRLVQTAGWQKWRLSAARMVQDVLFHLDERYPERFWAVFLFAGGTCEWFSRYPADGLEPNAIAAQTYRNWAGPDAKIPSHDTLCHTTHGDLRDPAADADAIRYWRYHNDVIADTISWFALKVKEMSRGSRLVGVFYGYMMVLDSARLVSNGHNAYSQILNDENIDVVFSPAAYQLRRLDNTSGFQLPVDSLRLHKKLYFHEVDNTTHLVNDNPLAQALQKTHHKPMADLAQTVAYSRRETAQALMHGQGYWWFDMFAGWYDEPALMDELARIRRATEYLWSGDMRSASEIAVFIDEESGYFIGCGSCLHQSLVVEQAEQLSRIGAPWDCFVASDFCHPDLLQTPYRLFVFLNLVKPTTAIRRQIQALRRQGKSFLFVYAPGFLDENGPNLPAMQALTGLPFEQVSGQPDGQIATTLGGAPCVYGFPKPVTPLFTLGLSAAADPAIEVLGHYSQGGEAALALRTRPDGIDAWSGAGPLPAQVLRQLAVRSGVHIYVDTGDPVYVNRGLFGLFSHQGGQRTLSFPHDVVLHDVYDTRILKSEDGLICLDVPSDTMQLFQVTCLEDTP